MRTTDGLRRALARLGQPDQLPWSPSGRSWGSLIPGTRSRSWPSGAARLRRAAAAWSKRYDPLLRHGAEGADGLGSLGYQTGTSEPPPDEHGPATCPEWLVSKQARRAATVWEHGSFAAGPPPSPVHGASQAMLIDGRLGWAPDRCSTDGHVLLRKRGARYKMCITAQPACHVLEGSMCYSSYEGPWSGSSRSVHIVSPGNCLHGRGSAVNTM